MKMKKIGTILLIMLVFVGVTFFTKVYATDINEEISKQEETTQEMEDEEETSELEWTDVSNAKFEITKDGNNIFSYHIKIDNVTLKQTSDYYILVSKPNIKLIRKTK